MRNYYSDLDETAFWRSGVVNASPFDMSAIYTKRFEIRPDWNIACAGSCFAQHISGYLMRHRYNVMNVEPAPQGLPEELRKTYGYSLYSGRYGNIYTVRQLRQLVEETFEPETHDTIIWENNGRFFDAMRPSVEPEGLATRDAVARSRAAHLRQMKVLFGEMDLLIFTMGMTETWEHIDTKRVVPTAPGVIAGEDQMDQFQPKTLNFYEVVDDVQATMEMLQRHRVKPLHIILTVSPVPSTATASAQHVLPASVCAKATLRSAAGYLYDTHPEIDYFPSFELATNPAAKGQLFDPNLRTVTPEGVEMIMRVFLSEHGRGGDLTATVDPGLLEDTQCEDALLDAFGA